MASIIPRQTPNQNIFLFYSKFEDKTENKTGAQSAYSLHQGALTGAAPTAKAPAGYRQHGALAIQGPTTALDRLRSCPGD
ncbi:MAG TPA: hypothetical protein PLZ14_07670 [Acidovorax temperans]|nr:hypothetical protein [Acidovorax temperans]